MKSSNISYIPALDHLRFFAASIVVIYHGILIQSGFFQNGVWTYSANPFYTFFIEGHSAVSLFMALSGFIFTIGSAGKAIDYLGFITNRFLRIYPLFIALIVAGLFFYPEGFAIGKLLKTLFLMANTTGALVIGPFSSMFWTISVEFQFYLIFPLIAWGLRRYGVKAIVIVLACAIAARAAAALMGADLHYLWFWTLLGRIDQFLMGMVAAKIFIDMPEKRWGRLWAPALALAFVMLWAFNTLGGWPSHGGWKVLWPVVEGAVWAFFLLAYISAFKDSKGFIATALARLGEVSYSMYLLHILVWYVIMKNKLSLVWSASPIENAFINSLIIVLPATVLVSAVTYNVIERPFLRFRRRYLKPL